MCFSVSNRYLTHRCRFSAGDVIARSRESIGAPNNVPVYAVDGSLVLDGESL